MPQSPSGVKTKVKNVKTVVDKATGKTKLAKTSAATSVSRKIAERKSKKQKVVRRAV